MILRDTVDVLERRFLTANSRFSKRRARVLDELAVSYLQQLLPGSRGYTELYYEGTELDGLVLFEDLALVIEGKATGLSTQGQRGDLTRLARDVERAVEDACRQGARARGYLLGDVDAVFTDERGKEILRVRAGEVSVVHIVNPTLHELAGVALQLSKLEVLGLFADDEIPWSVYINDIRVLAETCENAAVFLHYLAWRSRLPLGDVIVVNDELDLWGAYLNAERFWGLDEMTTFMIGNSSTDFDAYYAGLAGEGPPARRPHKFLVAPMSSFVASMALLRPPGWLGAAGVCLDLSIPEQVLIHRSARRLWRDANASRQPETIQAGRVRLVALPPGTTVEEVRLEAEASDDECAFVIYIRGGKEKVGEIVWAVQIAPISFRPSTFERRFLQETGARGDASEEPVSRGARPRDARVL